MHQLPLQTLGAPRNTILNVLLYVWL